MLSQIETLQGKCYRVIGAAIEVHRTLGRGLLESIYQEALSIELDNEQIPNKREVEVQAYYKDRLLDKYFKLDMLCWDDLIVELKVADELSGIHREQLFNYMRLTHIPYGLLINFGDTIVRAEKYVLDAQNNIKMVH